MRGIRSWNAVLGLFEYSEYLFCGGVSRRVGDVYLFWRVRAQSLGEGTRGYLESKMQVVYVAAGNDESSESKTSCMVPDVPRRCGYHCVTMEGCGRVWKVERIRNVSSVKSICPPRKRKKGGIGINGKRETTKEDKHCTTKRCTKRERGMEGMGKSKRDEGRAKSNVQRRKSKIEGERRARGSYCTRWKELKEQLGGVESTERRALFAERVPIRSLWGGGEGTDKTMSMTNNHPLPKPLREIEFTENV
ncbi:hypothetical protein CC1G_15586 [Coprinopsis cinerea okayama7|uniref:Uncharacterized protein n=1 Tax=Coprinopsis cinerea (strain Okayama-7 / 130 / ATCC MYA-4618 / FGSC 9003) TaxID=240176 RepID=D6RN73_COPC7|nr:hypothetical protein CC1G_15586 [Coprinopsis cinerea okayama7\|eukprot:XP_002911043.1 hypothetical protein CC1G_15586 [Coprinopsis cinerea okayama7\